MKIKNGFVLREIAGSIVVVPTGERVEEFKGMIHLNVTGKFIWEVLQEDRSMEEVADRLVEKYKIEREHALKSVEIFIRKLQDANILE